MKCQFLFPRQNKKYMYIIRLSSVEYAHGMVSVNCTFMHVQMHVCGYCIINLALKQLTEIMMDGLWLQYCSKLEFALLKMMNALI